MKISSSLETGSLKKTVSRTVLFTALLAVAGCSTPDWVNPVNWFDDDGDARRPGQIEQPAPAEGDFPKLGSVPDEAGKTVSIEEARDIEEGLKADRSNAQYTDDKLRADTGVQPAPRPKAPVAPAPAAAAAPTGPAVAAVPVAPVSSGQIAQPAAVPAGTRLMPNAAPVTSPQQAYARMAPGTGTTVISGAGVQDVFQQQLAASAATTTTLPANTQFQSYPTQPLGATAVAVPQIVQDTYNRPVALGYGAAVGGGAVQQGGGYGASGTSGVQPDATIYFETGSSRLDGSDRKKIAVIANAQKQTGAMVRVVGHASSRTRELPIDRHLMVNLRMSQERSSAVVASLIQMGVGANFIVVEAVSDRSPVVKEAMPSDEAKNRRTEIFLVK